jgi:putative ABC transport system ATP-binding protein
MTMLQQKLRSVPRTGSADEPVIELRRVTKEYSGSSPVPALRGVTLTVRRGEFVAIVGPSGSGKTTLLSIMGTLERASGGNVRLAGHDVQELSDRLLSALRAWEIGFVFQGFFLLNGMTALDNVADGLLYTGRASGERKRIAYEMLTNVGLGHRLHHHPARLSGGERQRVAIARAMAGSPSLLLADEPTGNLDSNVGRQILDILRQLNDEGTTVVVITHDREIGSNIPRQVEIRDGLLVHDTQEVSQ